MRRGEPACSPCGGYGAIVYTQMVLGHQGRHVGLPLPEYRSALITNAVTGKIDVRDFKLPTEASHA